jgi:hypothetical protein
MSENHKIDFSKLLGFQVMSEELAGHIDFRDETFAGRLGAKVGVKETAPQLAAIDDRRGD